MAKSNISKVLEEAHENGRPYYTEYMTLVLPDDPELLKKTLVVTGLKLSKKAVVRNQLRRRLREIIRDNPPSRDVLIIPKKKILDLEFDELKKEYKKALDKLPEDG